MTWFAVYVAPRADRKAETHLQERGFDAYSPCERVYRRKSRDRSEPVNVPILPGYVFVQVRFPEQSFRAATLADGVQGFVTICDRPAEIPSAWVDELRAAETRGDFDRTKPRGLVWAKGTKVKITAGTLQGFAGQIAEASGKGAKVKVLLDAIGAMAGKPVDIPVGQLKAA